MNKFLDNVLLSLQKLVSFIGKASVSEFWSFIGFNIIIFLVLYFLDFIYVINFKIYFFIVTIPFYAVFSRRMQDVGLWGAIVFLPFVIIAIYYTFIDKRCTSSSCFNITEIFILFFILNFILLIIALIPGKIYKAENKQNINKEETKREDETRNL